MIGRGLGRSRAGVGVGAAVAVFSPLSLSVGSLDDRRSPELGWPERADPTARKVRGPRVALRRQ